MRVDLEALFKEVPSVLHAGLRHSSYYASKSQTLVISSDESRKQGDNQENCKVKLCSLIREIAHRSIPGETSAETRRRVASL